MIKALEHEEDEEILNEVSTNHYNNNDRRNNNNESKTKQRQTIKTTKYKLLRTNHNPEKINKYKFKTKSKSILQTIGTYSKIGFKHEELHKHIQSINNPK